jgi:hypothetical protein
MCTDRIMCPLALKIRCRGEVFRIHVFLAIRIRIHLSEIWIRILLSLCKNNKKNVESYYFVTLFDFFIFEKCKCTFKKLDAEKIVLKIIFLLASSRLMTKIAGSDSISQRRGSGSSPKCHGSGTLPERHMNGFFSIQLLR